MLGKLRKNNGIARYIFAALCINLAGASVIQLQARDNEKKTQLNRYSRLAYLHLPSLVKQETAEQKEANKVAEHNRKIREANRKRFFHLAKTTKNMKVGRLGDVEAMRFVYENFGKIDGEIPSNTVKDSVHHDMESFCGSDRSTLEHHVFGALNNTCTKSGAVELQRILAEPTEDVATLTKRQTIVRKLVEDEALFNEIDKSLNTFAASENETLWFWREMDPATTEYFNQAYWQNFLLRNYKSDENVLELNALYTNIISPLIWLSFHPILGLHFRRNVKIFVEKEEETSGRKKSIEEKIKIITQLLCWGFADTGKGMKVPSSNMYNSTFEYLKFFLKRTLALDASIVKGKSSFQQHGAKVSVDMPSVARSFWGVTSLMYYSFLIYRLSSSIKSAIDFNATVKEMQKRLMHFGTACSESYNIARMIKQAGLSEEIGIAKEIAKTFSSSSYENSGNKLANTLTTNTFKGEPSALSHQGRILASFEIIKGARDHFIGMMKAVGELDAYMSIAKLYKKFANHPNATYCFPEYVTDSSLPYINIQEFWHPILDADKVVTNSLELGGVTNKARNFIITGPNAGGKSTVLKSVTLATILAQTFGIAPARSMKVTPFSLFNTYMNIADTEGKASLFQAEMHRAQDLLVEVMQLKSDKFSFTVMDEIFTGTNPKEGMAAAYGIAKKLSSYKNSMNLIATHFMVLTELEADTAGLFTNKKVRINRDPAGMIKYLYKLEDGITDQAIALELLEQEGFDNDILSDAYAVMARKAKKYEQTEAAA